MVRRIGFGRIGAILLLAVTYLGAAKLGLKLAYVNEYTTAVWPPTGIALTAFLLWGYWLWPGVLVGAFLVNGTTGGALTSAAALASVGIAAGNTLEALVGAYLINRFAGGRRVFDQARDIFRFAALAALVSTSISATFGGASLLLAGLARWVDAPAIWFTWWIGDGVGALVFAPALILWALDWRLEWNRTRAFEAGLLLLAVSALSLFAFTSLLPGNSAHPTLAFLCTPALLWAAFRFGQRVTASTLLLISGIAMWGWVHGMLSEEFSRMYVLLELQAYFGVISVTMLAVAAEVSQRRRHQLALEQLAAIVESSGDAIFRENRDGAIMSWNAGGERIYGYASPEVIGRQTSILTPPGYEEEMPVMMERIHRGENVDHAETKGQRKDGTIIDVSVTVSPIKSGAGEITGASVVARDITDRKRMEEQIRQAQKLESIGVLAGGVAHDFNNLLVAILGNASLALEDLASTHPSRRMLQDVVRAGEKAAALVRQLLAYAGKGQFVTEPVRLAEVVGEIAPLAQSCIPKKVELRFELMDDVPQVLGDPGQIQQIVMNLVINAAEAIGGNAGTILVTLKEHEIAQSNAHLAGRGGESRASRYAELRVEDNGSGMDEATRSRIFDPFFTTKFTGRGLGMASVLGIVRRHKGIINVSSTPGLGTTFEVLLPALEDRRIGTGDRQPQLATPGDLSGAGIVLVVDDEQVVRQTAKIALERYGYKVLLAESGREGIEVFRRRESEISVVLLDMMMPAMGGEDVIERLTEIRPEVPVIVSSGYNEALTAQRFAGKGVAGFIQKPYTSRQLAEKVNVILAAKEGK